MLGRIWYTYVLVQFMMMKRLQTIALDVLLLDEEETSEKEDKKRENDHYVGVDQGFNVKIIWILLRKNIFVAATLQYNQKALILLQCFRNIFWCCKQQKSFWNHVGLFVIFFLRFLFNIWHCKHQKNVSSGP